jgi:hypothetical protein
MNFIDLLTAEKISGVLADVLRRHIRRKQLPAQQFAGGRYLINTTDLNEFLIRYRAHEFDTRFKKA